ncbi:MAG: hypothetical protein L3J18_13310 [Candidatus Brocadia sp.]|jgi:hypothetical protein|nr:MAG: hypothetical protein L3J18_13310 [Candidatus Brocadia sp.]
MTATMHFDGTLHVVIASEAKQSFTHKKRHLLKEVCEKTYKKKKFLYSNTIAQQGRNQFTVVKAGDCFGQDPRNDTGYAFDDIRYVVIASKAKQSFPRKQTVPSDKG